MEVSLHKNSARGSLRAHHYQDQGETQNSCNNTEVNNFFANASENKQSDDEWHEYNKI